MTKHGGKQTVAVIGAGNVGATLAMRIAESGTAEVVLVDICGSIAGGKALDIVDTAGLTGSSCRVTGTDSYPLIRGARIVVVTAGFPRKPGMSREELVAKNAAIVGEVVRNVTVYAPGAIVVMVTNPLDVMTYLAWTVSGFPRERVVGMAGLLDESRFVALLARELDVAPKAVKTVMMGSHGDTMVPVLSHTTVNGAPVAERLSAEALDALVRRTRSRGAEIVGLLGSGSAYYSPSLAAFRMVEMILKDTRGTVTASAVLEGEYGMKGLSIGVPLRLGGRGIESIQEITLTGDERSAFQRSAAAIKKTINAMPRGS